MFRASVVIRVLAIIRVGVDKLASVGLLACVRNTGDKSADSDVCGGACNYVSKCACGRVDGVCGRGEESDVRGGMNVGCEWSGAGGSATGYGAN